MIDGANSHRLFQRLSLDRPGRSIFVSDFSLNRRTLKKRKHFSGSQVVDLVADRRERERERERISCRTTSCLVPLLDLRPNFLLLTAFLQKHAKTNSGPPLHHHPFPLVQVASLRNIHSLSHPHPLVNPPTDFSGQTPPNRGDSVHHQRTPPTCALSRTSRRLSAVSVSKTPPAAAGPTVGHSTTFLFCFAD